ncbi:hypothetical protein AB0D04_08160 [Streptomyces sp. NPDC048483]|uniref:hypothetical protein n=1 Tax=Streptomyces sp. NPDC048483 TaxID=3154927 RepID=UPI00341842CB
MSTKRLTRALAVTAGGLLLAGGAAFTTAGTASAAPTHAAFSYSSHYNGHGWGDCNGYDDGRYGDCGYNYNYVFVLVLGG